MDGGCQNVPNAPKVDNVVPNYEPEPQDQNDLSIANIINILHEALDLIDSTFSDSYRELLVRVRAEIEIDRDSLTGHQIARLEKLSRDGTVVGVTGGILTLISIGLIFATSGLATPLIGLAGKKYFRFATQLF